MSAAAADGTRAVVERVAAELAKLPPVRIYEAEPELVEAAGGERITEITVENGVYVVTGQWLLNVLGSVNFDDYESLQYLHKVLTNGKVYDLLEEKGIKEGDTVSIYGVQFEYVR